MHNQKEKRIHQAMLIDEHISYTEFVERSTFHFMIIIRHN